MAAEPDNDKPGKDEERPSSRDRRRPPLTIDLTAAPAAAKPAAPSTPAESPAERASQRPPPPPPQTSRANAEPPPAAKTASRPEPQSRTAGPAPRPMRSPLSAITGLFPPTTDREGWVGLGSAAAFGGVIALLLLMLLQATGVLPAPGVGAARQAADQARAATDSLGSIDRRLTAVEAMTESLPILRADVTATAARVTMAEQNATALAAKSDVAALRTDLTALRARLDQAPPSATPAEVSALATRLARLEATAAGTPVPAAPAATTAPTSEAEARIASLAARLDAAEAAIAKLSAAPTSGPVVATNATNARTAAVSALRRAVDTGVPFAAELDMVAAFGSDPMISGLRPYAAEGIATRDTLRADFAKVGDAILVATQVNDESLFGRLVAGARSLVSVRPVGPIAGSDPVAIVSRMDAAVAQGDFATPLREREGLPAVGKEASAAWAARVNQRLTADALLGQPAPAAGTVNR